MTCGVVCRPAGDKIRRGRRKRSLQSIVDLIMYAKSKVFIVAAAAVVSATVSGDAQKLDQRLTCGLIGGKLSSVSVEYCLERGLQETGVYTALGRSILYKEYPPKEGKTPNARVLLIGGMHGDEYASFSVVLKWMGILDRHHSGLFHWHIVPALNLDGLLESPAVRGNHNGVDLNRNLATGSWDDALRHWREATRSDLRRYPGPAPLSENESRWLTREIENFKPDVIVSVHSPYKLVDYDGPGDVTPPSHLGSLKFRDLGTFPGSLGRYAGEIHAIPVLTIELASSRYMPSNEELRTMWVDLVRWLRDSIRPKKR